MASDSFKRQQVQKVFGNSISAAEDILAAEEPLEIAVSYFPAESLSAKLFP